MILGSQGQRSRRRWTAGLLMACGLLGIWAATLAGSAPAAARPRPSRIDHVFLIVLENNGFSDVIGNPAAPNLNSYAQRFGVATEYYGVNGTSEPNYVGLLGGSTARVTSDNAYWTQKVKGPSLISELDGAGIGWKAYLESLPHPGYEGICYPLKCNGAPDSDPLYVSKHDGIQNFTSSLNPQDWSRQVPIGQLTNDLASGRVPRFSYIVPDECDDMHGDPPYCIDSGNIGDPQNQRLVAVGDRYLGTLVNEITRARSWGTGNNAIVITFDSGDNGAGCCDARPGGGQVATVVITSHGPRGLRYPTPSNHYSLLSTLQRLFGLRCLRHTCDEAHVKPMLPLFAVTGSPAIATRLLPTPRGATPTPVPVEPVSATRATSSAGGWTVDRAQRFGTSDNSLGAIAGSSPDDIWAVGDFLPDARGSNPDATLSFAEHFDGKRWQAVETPDDGPNFNSFYGVTASRGQAWAVGERLNGAYEDRALIERFRGPRWSVVDNPQPGALRDMLFSASALSPSNVWVAGDQEGADGRFETLVEHWNGSEWSVSRTPNPGTTGNHLYGITAVAPNDVWAVGQELDSSGPDQALIEHWDGTRWSVIASPVERRGTTMLDAVAGARGEVWAVGEHDSPSAGGRPLIEHYQHGKWGLVSLPSNVGSNWTDLYGVTVDRGTTYAVGTYLDPKTGNNDSLLLDGERGRWRQVAGPQPGSGSNFLGGVATVAGRVWAAGMYDNGGSELPLIEHR
jgi:hypothetical protein